MNLLLISGNQHKLNEWRRIIPDTITLESLAIDLPEIQGLNTQELIEQKAREAFLAAGKPIVVEDISAGIDVLKGLPGPFVKFFEQQLGSDALFQLGGGKNPAVGSVSCTIAYYDGQNMVTVVGQVKGTFVAARGKNGFGFDKSFIPEGSDKTYGEMTEGEKDSVSHRGKAIHLLVKKLQSSLN